MSAPEQDDLDAEIRGHIALSVKERVERGEDPEAARQAALREFGNPLRTRESMQEVWRPGWLLALEPFAQDLRVALRSLGRAKGLSVAVALTLALGIGANAAVFSVVRQVLFRPLVNRDEARLIYVRQSAPGLGAANTTFSMPEIGDLRARSKTVAAFGDFSTIDFTLVGFGEPRVVQAGVVSGSYFEVMGLRPVLGRLIEAKDDGPAAAPVAVLTHRFWSESLQRDPAVVGRKVQLGSRAATVVGVLEPSLPYPAATEIIANVVTSPHHMGAVMVTQRTHRMTELFGRLAPGATLEAARGELLAIHAAMLREHPDAYAPEADMRLAVRPLREQLTAPARTTLLMLLAAAAVVFAIACSNVANLILARSVRREKELAVRAALGAGTRALRRTLLAESLVLCGAGAVLGVLLARPLLFLVARFAARFSVRALDVTVDASLLFVGAALAMGAAVVLAYVPRLPSLRAPAVGQASEGLRLTPGTNRRLRAFAVAQVALSFVLLSGAGMILATLLQLQRAHTGLDMRQVLAVDVPQPIEMGEQSLAFFEQATRRIAALPGVRHVAVGSFVPWRDVNALLPRFPFSAEGHAPEPGEDPPYARFRNVTPGFFAALGVPLLAGRDFGDADRRGGERVVIVSRSVAERLFRDGDALGKRFFWTHPLFGNRERRRIVGIVADVDDESVVPGAALTVYHPIGQIPFGGRLFVHASGDPYALVEPVRRVIRELSPLQPVERAATLGDVRAQVLAPERLNAFVLSGFAGVALLIAVVGVAGVLAFMVSARLREFGVLLAIGASRGRLVARVLADGAVIAAVGIAAGALGGFALGRIGTRAFDGLGLASVPALFVAAVLLLSAALAASAFPAVRASRVDVLQALRSE